MKSRVGCRRSSVLPASLLVGVEPGVVGAGRGSDTLLGFEGSDFLFASSDRVPRGGCEAVVGWLFVNWIVDASICGSSTP